MLARIILITAALGTAINANPLAPRASTIKCHFPPAGLDGASVGPAGYLLLLSSDSVNLVTSAFAGYRTDYKLSNALKAVGSSASAGLNPEVLLDAAPFSGSNNNFGFQACASSYLRYPANDTTTDSQPRYYGQITADPTTNPGQCVTRHYVEYGREYLTLEKCLTADDVNLTTQYFRGIRTQAGYEANKWAITNVGHPKDTSGKIYYWQPGTKAQPAWTVHPEQPNAYTMTFEEIHIN